MSKVIPMLPCPNIKTQCEFYEHLGFEVKAIYTSPNPYAVLLFGDIELHFYGSRKMIPAHNSSMCFIVVEDVDAVCETFTSGLKKNTGKIPRSGAPKITKVRDLASDRRFTLTDTGGNTLYIGTPVKGGESSWFRTLENQEWAQKFAVLYDILYSKEDPPLAANMLPKLLEAKKSLDDLDKAKLLLVEIDIQRHLDQPVEDKELKALLKTHKKKGGDWEKMEQRYQSILQND